jgi:hypothetical protein
MKLISISDPIHAIGMFKILIIRIYIPKVSVHSRSVKPPELQNVQNYVYWSVLTSSNVQEFTRITIRGSAAARAKNIICKEYLFNH